MPKLNGLTHAWYRITYRLQPGTGVNVTTVVHTALDFFWDDFTESYRKDHVIILRGGSPQHAFPARQVLNIELRPARADEIPKGASR